MQNLHFHHPRRLDRDIRDVGTKGHPGIYLLAVALAAASFSLSAAPSKAPAPSTASPPSGHYDFRGQNFDAQGKFQIAKYFVTGLDQLGEMPVVWVRITRFKDQADPKSGYPAEYLRLEADCRHDRYVASAKFLLDANGRDLNPGGHFPPHPARRKMLNTHTGVYNDPALSAPELMAVQSLDQDCTAPE